MGPFRSWCNKQFWRKLSVYFLFYELPRLGGGGFILCRLQFSFPPCLPPNRVMMADTASVLSYRTFPCCPISRTVVVISSDLGYPLGWFRDFFLFLGFPRLRQPAYLFICTISGEKKSKVNGGGSY